MPRILSYKMRGNDKSKACLSLLAFISLFYMPDVPVSNDVSKYTHTHTHTC